MRASAARAAVRGAGRVVAAGAIAWAAVVLLLVLMESRLIYFPMRDLAAQPGAFGLAHEELRPVTGDGIRLHGWWLKGRGHAALVWYHGNAGNISHRLDNARELITRFGLDLFLIDYRGYGLSEGTPSEAGVYRDGVAAYEEARRRGFGPDRVLVFGRSLGAAVAVEVALAHDVRAIVLETPFRSVPAMARDLYPFVPRFLIRSRYDTEEKIARVRAPVLILHGDRDDIVPLAHARRLFELAPEPKRFHLIRGAGHNDTYFTGGDAYFEAWREFLGSAGLLPPDAAGDR